MPGGCPSHIVRLNSLYFSLIPSMSRATQDVEHALRSRATSRPTIATLPNTVARGRCPSRPLLG
jgi:hypothetical protein